MQLCMLLDSNLNNIYMSFTFITFFFFFLKSGVSTVCILKLIFIPLASMVPLQNLQMNANMGFLPRQLLKGSGYRKWFSVSQTDIILEE